MTIQIQSIKSKSAFIPKKSSLSQKGAMIMDNMVAVGFILLLLGGVVWGIPKVSHGLKVTQFQTQEASITSAAIAWKKARPNYSALSGITKLCERQLLDKSICGASNDGKATNPFGGDWNVVGSNGKFTVTAGLASLDPTEDNGRILDLADTMAPSTKANCSSADACSSISVTGNTLAMTH